MLLHRTSGRWQLGLSLSLVTAILWGTIPNILSIALQNVDTYTLTWFRFLSSFLLSGVYISLRHGRTGFKQPRLNRTGWLLLVVAILGVGLDYPLYLWGMAKTSPANAEVMIQLAPLLLGLGAIVIFKERYSLQQWLGVGILSAGFVLFFREQLRLLLVASGQYLTGSALVMLAAVCWVAYALAQKQLLRDLSSELIMLIIYGSCALLYLPVAQPASLLNLDRLTLGVLLLSGLSTLISYGAFAESLAHWEASKISAVQSLTPIVTIATSWVIAAALPGILAPASLTSLGFLGALLVMGGSILIALGQRLKPAGVA